MQQIEVLINIKSSVIPAKLKTAKVYNFKIYIFFFSEPIILVSIFFFQFKCTYKQFLSDFVNLLSKLILLIVIIFYKKNILTKVINTCTCTLNIPGVYIYIYI